MTNETETKETHLGLHTYSNGGMSDCFIVEENSAWVDDKPVMKIHNRLIIGRGKKADKLRFQILRFRKRLEPFPTDWEYVGDEDMDRYAGFGCSSDMAVKIKESIIKMGF